MKLNVAANNDVLGFSSAGASEHTYDADINAKTFKALSDGLYKNKIGSIVREISSNALDAHIEAGTPDLPFEIHLPTKLEPWFSVKDNGIGLRRADIEGTYEEVPNYVETLLADGSIMKTPDGTTKLVRKGGIYTTMFRSSKDNSNDQIGGWGLGAKTPYSYTDSFALTTIKDGVKYFYSSYINDHGLPATLLLAEEETAEHNGVEVKIAVEPNDYVEFANEVANQLQFFKVKPTITNASVSFSDTFVPGNPKLLYDSDNIKVTKTSEGESYAVLGVVGYPLEIQNLRGIDNKVKTFLTDFEGKIALYFNIGEIEVTASREGIQYTPATIKAISDKVEKSMNEILLEIRKRVSFECVTSWDKASMANSYGDLTQLYISSGFNIPGTITYNSSYENKAYYFETYNIPLLTYNKHRRFSVMQYANHKNKLKCVERDVRYLLPSRDVIIFLRDSHRKIMKRLETVYKEHVTSGIIPDIYVIKMDTEEFDDTDIKILSEGMGGYSFRRLSDLPLPPNAYTARARRNNTNNQNRTITPVAYKLNFFASDFLDGRLNEYKSKFIYDSVKDIAPGYYLATKNGVIVNRSCEITVNNNVVTIPLDKIIEGIGKVCEQMQLPCPDIYAFNEKQLEKVKQLPGWKDAMEFFHEYLSNLQRNKFHKLIRYKVAKKVFSHMDYWLGDDYTELFLTDYAQFNKRSAGVFPFRALKLSQKIKNDNVLEVLNTHFSSMFNLGDKVDQLSNEVINRIKEVKSKLPLIATMPHRYDNIDNKRNILSHLIRYINHFGSP